jgi:hypothetical protein
LGWVLFTSIFATGGVWAGCPGVSSWVPVGQLQRGSSAY